jgi:hypothetical protein
MKIAIRVNGKMSCLISHQENCSETPVNNSSKNAKNNLKITIALSSGLSILMKCLKY